MFSESDIENQFWVNRRGKIIKWGGDLKELNEISTSIHSAIAQQELTENVMVQRGLKSGTDILNKLGWIAIGSHFYKVKCSKPPSQSQINTLFNLGFNQKYITEELWDNK